MHKSPGAAGGSVETLPDETAGAKGSGSRQCFRCSLISRYIAEEYLMFSGPSLSNFSAQSSLLVHAFLFGDS